MSIQIESDLKEILERIEKRFDKIDERFDKVDERFEKLDNKVDERFEKLDNKIDQLDNKVDNIDKRLIKVETKLDSTVDVIKEINGTQKSQIWALITILFAAITGLLVAFGKFVISGNGV